MALGGGTFITQNRVLPGAYINVISAANASPSLSDRGYAAVPFVGDWGTENTVIEVSTNEFQKNSLYLFGYPYTHDKLKGFRDLFINASYVFFYRLNRNSVKAENTYATAKCGGIRGNDLKVVIQTNIDEPSKFDVYLYFDSAIVDKQTVSTSSELNNNHYVIWKSATLSITAGLSLTGGTTTEATNGDYQVFLEMIESYSFNAVCCPTDSEAIKSMFIAFNKRMRDEQGVKFQCVVHNKAADYEGVVNVKSNVYGDSANAYDAVYWVTGVIAGTPVNGSALNKVYNGEYQIDVDFTQAQLISSIKNGEFVFHRVGSDIRVLEDINSLVNLTAEKGEDFKYNQTIRVVDQIGNDIAALFNTKYLGIIPNDADGRISLWSDIVKHHEQLQSIRAIQDFSSDNVTVEQGNTKRSVVVNEMITPTYAMAQLYMTCVVS